MLEKKSIYKIKKTAMTNNIQSLYTNEAFCNANT